MLPKRILTLLGKDFFEFIFSKSWVIMLIMPLFICFLYAVVYRQAEAKKFTVAYTNGLNSGFIQVLDKSRIALKSFPDLTTAKRALEKGKIDGIIIDDDSQELSLLVDKARSQEAILIVNAINLALLNAYQSGASPLKVVYINNKLPVRWLSFPVWLLQIILTTCLLQAVAAVAKEKESQTLHSLLVSPMSYGDYFLSKLFWYAIITMAALFLTILITQAPVNVWCVLAFGIGGAMIFTATSLLIGLLTPTDMLARAVATLFYIVAALPIMARDLSFSWKESLYFFPSYLVLKGLEQALLPNPCGWQTLLWLAGLLVETLVLLIVAKVMLLKKADF